MSRAFLFGDQDPVIVEIKEADADDILFMQTIGATVVGSILGGDAFALDEAMIIDVADRWPRCEISGKPIENTYPKRHQIVVADEKYL